MAVPPSDNKNNDKMKSTADGTTTDPDPDIEEDDNTTSTNNNLPTDLEAGVASQQQEQQQQQQQQQQQHDQRVLNPNPNPNQSKSRNSSRSPEQMLRSQIMLLERQLLETRRLLHRQEAEQEQDHHLEEEKEGVALTSTPLQSNGKGMGKAYYGTLGEPLITSHTKESDGIPSEIRMTRNTSEAAQSTDTLTSHDHYHNEHHIEHQHYNGDNHGHTSSSSSTRRRHHYGNGHSPEDDGQHTAHTFTSGTVASIPERLHHMLDDAVATVQSADDFETKQEVNHESVHYLKSSIIERAFPERQFALFVTLLFELPVLFMISGGSDQLCALVGRSKYQLLMAFLPLTSAISGNVGLQASTLTTRAISHNHVTSSSYMPWFITEVGAAFCLALGMGSLLGSLALYASGWDGPFALTIFIAQVISIVTAGCTGTFAPLLFSFIFRRDSGKWGGPLETAVQDIVGSFAMVVISYKLLQMLGPLEIAPDDVCGGVSE